VGQLFAGSTAVQFLLDLIFFDGPVGEEAATIKDIAIPRHWPTIARPGYFGSFRTRLFGQKK